MTEAEGTELVTIGGLPALDRLAFEIGQAPSVCYFWLRDALFRSALAHRNEFLRRTGVRLNRRPSPANPNPIQAPRVGEVAGADIDRDILWIVTPPERRRQGTGPGILEGLGVHIETRNPVLVGQELGGEVTPHASRLIAVPIAVPAAGVKRGRRSPRAYRKAKPDAVLIARKSKRSGRLLLFERIRKGGSGKAKGWTDHERKILQEARDRADARRAAALAAGKKVGRARRVVIDRLVPRWVLLPRLTTEPRLEFHSTWRALEKARANFFEAAVRRIRADIAKGIIA